MVSVELMVMKPSLSSITVPGVTVLLPPAPGDQVMLGAGEPVATQVRVIVLPSSAAIAVLAGGLVILAGSIQRVNNAYLIIVTDISDNSCRYPPITVTVICMESSPTGLEAVRV